MGDCRRFLDRLTAYVDGLLSVEERAVIEQHLDACPPCQACASEEQAARTILRARAVRLRSAPVPPELRSRCEASLKGRKR